ncbi:hypothetical protein L873DRAFT_1684452 [Choiromyces venosus 120613-1]|uniref:SEC7 domain-containing protein n=1 Tax=Choiromyces venosus 120613-1 TaxID=1336337 RepID=A0A3N4JQW2_9PEZI|nr:hypothetical protein L873DRAFT_1684452 [Choiromyces venosus 120613-1]
MNPYLRSPVKSRGFDLVDENNESAYLQRGATIRTVASSDPISPKRPTFFGESMRHRDSGSHFNDDYSSTGKVYRKETRHARGNGNVDHSLNTRDDWDRPQTSPYSPNKQSFLQDNEEKEMRWPPMATRPTLSTRRSVGNVALERERQASIASSFDKPRQGSVVAKEQPIATVQEIGAHHAKHGKQQREARAGKALEVDTKNLENEEDKGAETSWLSALTPAIGTPTVMLQKDGPGEKAEPLREDDPDREEPSEEERETARRVFEGDEEIITKARVTGWLGEVGPGGARIRKAYMKLFDWSGINILSALRIFCGRLVFKGETQQVDRIMDAIAKRWCECNPRHGFKLTDIVFTILYSLLLLNTDLHMADIPQSQKMTRGQFIKNTMSSIRRIISETPTESKPVHHNTFPLRSQTPFRPNDDDDGSPGMNALPSATLPLAAQERKMSESRTSLDFKIDCDMDGGLALVKAPLGGGIRVWETQIEIVLKEFYASVKASALPLHGAPQEKVVETPHHSSLSVFGSNVLRRSPSTVSRAPSELSVSARNNRDSKLGAKWTAKNRSRPRLYNGSYAGSSRTSLEDRSMWSPSASSTWSKYSLDKTQTSMSVDSLGSAFTHGDYAQSIGFANALSHAIIREEAASGTSVDDRESTSLDYDDELELAGAPWAKEGMLKHKHHLESMDKKAKNRGWTECFAVIERGWMRLFQFNQSGKSKDAVVGVVGGGNWTENADAIGSFLLRQTIASALPPPGYSKARPNVWALSLPSGAVHFFEVGTAEIVKEFVSTANYWAARLSKEPLIGGVSNVEYGWSGNVLGEIGPGLTSSVSNTGESRPSLQISIRSSLDHGTMVRPRLPGDRVNITDWAPPSQSMVASSLGEAGQLRALETYVANIEAELARHNDLRSTMVLTFSPRHPNSAKAMNNWEKKSSYLLMEIIKFRTYIECLSSAARQRERLRAGESEVEVGDNNESKSLIST